MTNTYATGFTQKWLANNCIKRAQCSQKQTKKTNVTHNMNDQANGGNDNRTVNQKGS